MTRTFVALLAGLAIGVLIGIGVSPFFHSPGREAVSGQMAESATSALPGTRRLSRDGDEQGKIMLGNITTVPFQELYGILSTKSQDDIADISKQLRQLPPGPTTDAKITAFFKAWSHLDPGAALKAALTFGTKGAKAAAVSAVIDGADAAVASTLTKAINELPPDALLLDQKQTFLSNALTKWDQYDPVTAAAFADSLSGTNNVTMAMAYHAIALTWAQEDPQAALAWANAHGQGPGGQVVRFGAIEGWWEKDPSAAKDYVAGRATTPDGREEVFALASRMFNSDQQQAKDWVAGLSDVKARQMGSSTIANQIGMSDPKGAAEWAASLPNDVRASALSSAMYDWASADQTAAAQWLEGTTGGVRDDGLLSYSLVISNKDPVSGLNSANSIADPTKRDKAVESIVKSWMGRDPNSATAWIQSSPLPDATKQRLASVKLGG
jgi:hypothetical protein